jgi:Astacin (Peptidase family M12A)
MFREPLLILRKYCYITDVKGMFILYPSNIAVMIKTSNFFLTAILLMSMNAFLFSAVFAEQQQPPSPTDTQNLRTGDTNATVPFVSEEPRGAVETGSLPIAPNEAKPVSVENIDNKTFLYQGDILLSKPDVLDRSAPDKFLLNSQWPNGIIPYQIDPNIPSKERITDAMNTYWMQNTSVSFVELNETNRGAYPNFVTFVYSPPRDPSDRYSAPCASQVGMAGGEQYVLVPDWCPTGGLAHEIAHLVGLWHEQSRCDRDQFIELHLENTSPRSRHNWENVCYTDPDLEAINPQSPLSIGPYDYCSITHYGETAGSINGLPVMIPKQPVVGCEGIGQLDGLSRGDIAGVQWIYRD